MGPFQQIQITSCDTSTLYNVEYSGVTLNPGTTYSLSFTGGTPTGCYTYLAIAPTDTIDVVLNSYGDCATCQLLNTTPTPTETETPTPTPTLTQTPTLTPTISGTLYQYYLTGCCANINLQILSNVELTGLTIGQTAYLIWNNPIQGNCFTVVAPQVGYTVYYWDNINNSYQISADPGNLPPFADCAECLPISEEPCVTPTPTITPTETPTPTPTNTETPTVTPSVTPCSCQYVSVNVNQSDLNSASGNTNPSFDGVIFYQYNTCADPNPQVYESYSVAGNYTNSVCILANQFPASLLYYYQDNNVIDSQSSPGSFTSSFSLGGCCVDPTPTPTETPTQTQTPTNTQTPTPTETPTQTQTPTNTNTTTNTETPSATLTPTNTETPTPTVTPTNTNTPTVTPTNTNTPTVTPTNTNTPTVTPTNTNTPTSTGIIINSPILIQSCDTLIIFDVYYGATIPTVGDVFYMTFTGGTPSGCYTYIALGSSPSDSVDSKIQYVDCFECINPTPTPTVTQTNTPTVTPSEPYDVYLFEECGNSSNQFRFEYVPGILVVGDTYLISGPYFNGYATVIPYVATGTLYSSIGSTFMGPTSCPTPTPTPTITQTQTQTPSVTPTNTLTPTVTPTNGTCDSIYCFRTTLPTLSGYSGNYIQTGTYNLNYYYSGNGINSGVVYYTGSQWCLSDNLGGTCLLEGSTPCYSECPDISANYFNGGPCPTPTPSPVNCDTFDFSAYFDCDWEPLPTPSPSVDCGDVNFDVTSIGVTPTPTPSGNFCDGTGVSFSICQYTPPNPTPTITPTITLTKTVDVQGQATFVMLDEMFNCVNVKILVDCQTGDLLYTSDNLIYEGTPVVTGITMSVLMNNQLMCLTYVGTTNTISSNCNIDDIIAISNSCGTCNVFPSPTPTDTPQSTPQSTPTPSVTIGLTPTATLGNTPTPTNTTTITKTPTQTPTSTSHWVYVYESCTTISGKYVQIIQGVGVSPSTLVVNQTFQAIGRCWKYLGKFNTNYIAPPNVTVITNSGNYFGNTFVANPIFDTCTDCINWPGTSFTFFGNYTPSANSAQNACLSYNTGRPYYSNTAVLYIGARLYDVYTSTPTNGNNNWVVLKNNPSFGVGNAVQINTSGYIIALQDVDTNSC